jgi:hypothetical protein
VLVLQARGSDRTMAAMIQALSTRVKYLQSLRLHTPEDEMRSIVMAAENNIATFIDKYPCSLPLHTATALIEIISEDATLFSESSRRHMIDKVNSKVGDAAAPSDVVALLPVAQTSCKQTMQHPENYFTQAIWNGLLDDEANQADVYMLIVAIFVRLGLCRPQETFWGLLVATLQWGSNNPDFDPVQVRDVLKRIWKNVRFIIPTPTDVPTEYPRLPAELLATHAELYHRAYPMQEVPIEPPKHLDYMRLRILRTTTGSRITKRPITAAAPLQWHLMALETMLVLGKLRPQRLLGEV